MFWLRFYVNNAAKTRPIAAFFEENAAIDLRQSVVQTEVEIYGCVFVKKRSYRLCFGCVSILKTQPKQGLWLRFLTKTQL